MIVFFLSVSAPPAVSFVVPPITTLGACWNVPYFSFSSFMLASFPPSFFFIPYDDRCLRRLHTVDTIALWHSSKWSSYQPITLQKQVTGGSVRVYGFYLCFFIGVPDKGQRVESNLFQITHSTENFLVVSWESI